ncbi:MAG: IS110 family RNA-guided transposase [Acidimicrobiales bacterium]
MLFVGVDWAGAHHDVCVLNADGQLLGRRRIADSLAGVGELHSLVAEHLGEFDEPDQVVVGIEKDHGLIVTTMSAAGYQLFAINPMAAARYRERHHVSGAKSDPGDAKLLADLVRTDRQNHRAVAGDSSLAEAVKVLARAHQSTIWTRQRQTSTLRCALIEYYPGALEAFKSALASRDALAVLAAAPTPALGRTLSRAKLISALKRGGRQRNLEKRAIEIQAILRLEQLAQPVILETAYGITTKATVAVIAQLNATIAELEEALSEHFEQHPNAKIIHSLPGMGTVLGARVLGEFGDDPNRYANAKSRRNYAGTSPVTRASGKSKVVLARHGRNKHLADALDQWAFCSTNWSPGARNYYDELRARDKTYRKAIRQLANRWVGILHACLEQGCLYDEEIAWSSNEQLAA